jgi:hypothetical protein
MVVENAVGSLDELISQLARIRRRFHVSLSLETDEFDEELVEEYLEDEEDEESLWSNEPDEEEEEE